MFLLYIIYSFFSLFYNIGVNNKFIKKKKKRQEILVLKTSLVQKN